MLNALKLSELLAKNVNPQLYPRMFVMSPNGTLMAYSTPVDIKELRDQAALISMAWKEQSAKHAANKQSAKDPHSGDLNSPTSPSGGDPDLETLTIETANNNIIIRAIQPSLLLVLVGGLPPSSRRNVFRITPEAKGDPRYPPSNTLDDEDSAIPRSNPRTSSTTKDADAPSEQDSTLGASFARKKAPSILSNMSQRDRDIKTGALHIQRKKLDALTEYIRKDFNEKGFVMPDDSSFP